MKRGLLLISLVLLQCAWALSVELMPTSEIKLGMRGKTHTVLQGSEIVELETEILGVQKNGLSAGYDLIIGKLVDPRTELSGAVHGMSGSPLYINGKLVGALSRRIAFFEKDGHCGFTPIEDILKVNDSLGDTKNTVASTLDGLLPLPWSFTQWIEALEPKFRALLPEGGLMVRAGRVSSSAILPAIQAGSPLATVMVDGDLQISATGTATLVKDDEVWGFGHPAFGIGQTEMPFASAEIVTVVPSYAMAYKLANLGERVGVMKQDRLSTVYGKLGEEPVMAEYHFERKHEGQARPTLSGNVVRHPSLVPRVLPMLLALGLQDGMDASVPSTLLVDGEVTFNGGARLPLRMAMNAGDFAPWTELSRWFELLYQQHGTRLNLEAMKVSVESFEQNNTWQVVELEPLQREVKIGELARVRLTLRKNNGDEKHLEQSFDVPQSWLGGTLQVRVSTGESLRLREINRVANPQQLTLPELLKLLDQPFFMDAVYLEWVGTAEGVVQGATVQQGLPHSLLEVWKGVSGKRVATVTEKVFKRDELRLAGAVMGSANVEIKVSP